MNKTNKDELEIFERPSSIKRCQMECSGSSHETDSQLRQKDMNARMN